MSEQLFADRPVLERGAPRQAVTQMEIDQRVFDLYDEYCHGRIDRREFLSRAKLARERTVAFFKKNLA